MPGVERVHLRGVDPDVGRPCGCSRPSPAAVRGSHPMARTGTRPPISSTAISSTRRVSRGIEGEPLAAAATPDVDADPRRPPCGGGGRGTRARRARRRPSNGVMLITNVEPEAFGHRHNRYSRRHRSAIAQKGARVRRRSGSCASPGWPRWWRARCATASSRASCDDGGDAAEAGRAARGVRRQPAARSARRCGSSRPRASSPCSGATSAGAVVHRPQPSKVAYMLGAGAAVPAVTARRRARRLDSRSSRRARRRPRLAPTGTRRCCRCCGRRSTPPRPPSTTPTPTPAWPASSTSTWWPPAATRPWRWWSACSRRCGPLTSTSWPGAVERLGSFSDRAARRRACGSTSSIYEPHRRRATPGRRAGGPGALLAPRTPGWGATARTPISSVDAGFLDGIGAPWRCAAAITGSRLHRARRGARAAACSRSPTEACARAAIADAGAADRRRRRHRELHGDARLGPDPGGRHDARPAAAALLARHRPRRPGPVPPRRPRRRRRSRPVRPATCWCSGP